VEKSRTVLRGEEAESEDEAHHDDVALELGNQTTHTDGEGQEWVQAEPGLEHTATDLTQCVERWKANADDDKKGMFECFDEAGIFTAVCRHGFLLTFCDIVQSGEL
jgi:hypothetical protein